MKPWSGKPTGDGLRHALYGPKQRSCDGSRLLKSLKLRIENRIEQLRLFTLRANLPSISYMKTTFLALFRTTLISALTLLCSLPAYSQCDWQRQIISAIKSRL